MKRFVLFVLGFGAVSALWATVPVREGEYPCMPSYPNLAADTTDPARLRFNYLYEFRQIADFIALWQLDDPDSVDDGGMIEAESGPLRPVIQTDNTQEAIWVWSRYGQLTGDTERYKENIDKAWEYCNRFPAWKEESQTGLYYPSHNCAWGIAAEQCYRNVYGDEDLIWYRDSCVDFIKKHPLNKWTQLDRKVIGWCAGWLYEYGLETGDQEALDTACVRADSLISFIELKTPQVILTEEYWAMSAGTIVWGICNSTFRRDSMKGKDWIALNGSYVDTFQPWRSVDYYSWDNSWNVAYANGHGAMYDISHDENYKRHHLWLTNKLLSYDTDNDGGIMATTQDADTIDMCWVTSYLAMMGLDRLIGEVHNGDAGVLEIRGIRNGDTIAKGTKLNLEAIVTNFGRDPLSGVKVTLSGDASGSWITDLGFLESDTILMKTNWVVPETAVLVVTTSHSEDDNHANDTIRIGINCKISEAVEEDIRVEKTNMELKVNPLCKGNLSVYYAIPAEAPGSICLYDVCGSLIARERLNGEKGILNLDASRLSGGVYFVRLESAGKATCQRVIILR